MTLAPMQVGSAAIPEAEKSRPATDHAALDTAIAALRAQASDWASSSIEARIELLRAARRTTAAEAAAWVRSACLAKGIDEGTSAEGEEWLAGPVCLMRNYHLLERTLEAIGRTGAPELPSPPYVNTRGRVVCPVIPVDSTDAILFSGFTAEVVQQPGITLENLREHMASSYRTRPTGGVSLVLGAGNVSSIGPMDALYKLYAEHEVVVLKMNPVNEYLGPHFERALAPFVERGLLRIVYGGGAEGEYLAVHPGIDDIHITGSDKTHDAIVYGVGEEGRARKERREPRNTKPVTSELGNVSPILVVPGPWSRSDLEFQARNLVSSLANNAGFNCNATRVIVTYESWELREDFLRALDAAFLALPPRAAYYPGATDRHATFLAAHPEAVQYGPRGKGRVPWTLISGLDPSNEDELCFTTEAWCGVTSEVALPASSEAAFVKEAVRFANDVLWGTLNAAILVHPDSLRDPAVATAVDVAVAELRFGSVAVNHWPALSYAFVATTWGAFPGHETHDIRSGRGVVHNTFLFDAPEKSIVRGPFRAFPKPAWFHDHRTNHRIGPRLVDYYLAPSPAKLAPIVALGLIG